MYIRAYVNANVLHFYRLIDWLVDRYIHNKCTLKLNISTNANTSRLWRSMDRAVPHLRTEFIRLGDELAHSLGSRGRSAHSRSGFCGEWLIIRCIGDLDVIFFIMRIPIIQCQVSLSRYAQLETWWLWGMQTFLLGYPSLSLLLAWADKKGSAAKKKWPTASDTYTTCIFVGSLIAY